MTIEIISLSPSNSGSEIRIAVEITEGGNTEKNVFYLLTGQVSELGLHVGEIDRETYERIFSASELCAAVKKGFASLGYGACSEKNMRVKLRSKGFSREAAEKAAAYLSNNGYIDEKRDAVREAENCIAKQWGIRRIKSHLLSKGYNEKAVAAAIEDISDTDFTKNCAMVIKKRYGNVPDDRNTIAKITGAMMRMGYTSAEVRQALSLLT